MTDILSHHKNKKKMKLVNIASFQNFTQFQKSSDQDVDDTRSTDFPSICGRQKSSKSSSNVVEKAVR